jgi:hypothetical protein
LSAGATGIALATDGQAARGSIKRQREKVGSERPPGMSEVRNGEKKE